MNLYFLLVEVFLAQQKCTKGVTHRISPLKHIIAYRHCNLRIPPHRMVLCRYIRNSRSKNRKNGTSSNLKVKQMLCSSPFK